MVEFGYLRKDSRAHKILLWLEQFLYNRADQVVVVTAGWTSYFAERGVMDDRLTVITNGAETADWLPTQGVPKIAQFLGVTTPVAVYAGAHGVPNGLEYILNAAAKHPEVTFAFFGDGVLKSKHMRRADDERLTNVRFCDPVPKRELARFLWTADVGIHTLADIELFKVGMSPNKLYDYMAAGIPVISNAGGIAHQMLAKSQAGFGVDPDGVADGISALLALSVEDRRAMGDRGRAWIEAHASRAAATQKLSSVLDKVCSQ